MLCEHNFNIGWYATAELRRQQNREPLITKGIVMARGINKVILIGNLGNDPVVAAMPSGNAVANISIATSETWTDKQTGQPQERTEWHRVVFFNRLAEIVGQYLKKGSKVYIEGSLRTRKWQDKNTGEDKYTTEIVAREMQMLDSLVRGGAEAAPSGAAARDYRNASGGGPAGGPSQAPPGDSFDDDIPF